LVTTRRRCSCRSERKIGAKVNERRAVMNFTYHLWTWVVLAVVVLGMAAYRYLIVHHEDTTLDIFENSAVASEQSKVFKKAHVIELWGMVLTAVVVLYGLVLAGAYLFQNWQLGQQMPK
jgi:hypothetical protein